MSFPLNTHVVLFPFMAKGHTIPLLHLARLLHRRHIIVTVITTPANLPFIARSLVSLPSISILSLPFPAPIPGIPDGVESTDMLPSMSLFIPFASATSSLQPLFEKTLSNLVPKPTFLVSDVFLGWTLTSASKLNIPRFAYYGISNQAVTLLHVMRANVRNWGLLEGVGSANELFGVSEFPWVKLSRSHFEPLFTSREPEHEPIHEFYRESHVAMSKSYGLVTNSFYGLESHFVDFWDTRIGPKSWCVGPLCLADPVESTPDEKPSWIQWLDEKHEQGCSVLYVAFGSQTEISHEQLREIEIGLEKSEVNFLWVTRTNNSGLSDGFEENVKEKGLVVRNWVDQREILAHDCVQGFLSHCGWNSVLESICAKVPILAWPMIAEQPLNARMVVEEMNVGIQVPTYDRSVRGFVKSKGLVKTIKELMEGEMGKEVRKRVKELGTTAIATMEEGGSSWHSLNDLINEMCDSRRASIDKIKCA